VPVDITDVDEFTDPITAPAGGDVRNSASVVSPVQKLSNRTRYLQNKGYTLKSIQVFSTAGGATWTKPAKVRAVRVTVIGGGGAGGGVPSTTGSQSASSAGGGGGGTAIAFLTSPGATESVTVGAGGAGSSTAGGNGGSSSFGAITAGGGGGGSAGAADADFRVVSGGSGGSVSTGDIRIGGGGGCPGVTLDPSNGWGGDGGASFMGMPSRGAVSGSQGNRYGGGGSGIRHNASDSASNGVDGGAGVVIVEEIS